MKDPYQNFVHNEDVVWGLYFKVGESNLEEVYNL
jgi:hypothetical protein